MAADAQDPPRVKDPLIGSRVGEYELLDVIGEGGMGVVYRGVQPVISKRVAVKILKPAVAQDEQHVKRLVAEAQAVNAVGHRNIVDIFGMGQLPDGRPYIVMEYLDGMALDAYLATYHRLPLNEVLLLINSIAAPLAAAHRAGVIHRDLKPSNVFLLEQDGQRFVKLLDFGLAKKTLTVDGTTAQTNQAVIAGTPDYMAPEQARGLPISPRSDIYSLGVLAFELITGDLPFRGQTAMDVMMAHVNTPIPSAIELNPGVPPALDELLRRMLAKAPEDRPQTVDEVRHALRNIGAALAQPFYLPSMSLPGLPAVSMDSLMQSATPNTPQLALAPEPPSFEAPLPPEATASTQLRQESVEAPSATLRVLPRVIAGVGVLLVVGGLVTVALWPAKSDQNPARAALVEAPDAAAESPRPVEGDPRREALARRIDSLRDVTSGLDPRAVAALEGFRRRTETTLSEAQADELTADVDAWEKAFLKPAPPPPPPPPPAPTASAKEKSKPGKKLPGRSAAPTVELLLRRIRALEPRAASCSDPRASGLLSGLRAKATPTLTRAERALLAAQLDKWERACPRR